MRIWSLTVVGLGLWMLGVSSPGMAAPTVEVAQGGVGYWPGEGCTRCYLYGRSWDAIEGSCFFPVDMDRRPDSYEIARSCGGSLEKGWMVVTEKACVQEDIEFPDTRYVELSAEDLARHHQEQAGIKPIYRRRDTETHFTLPLAKPAEPLPASDNFGACRTFNGKPKNRHTGADYAISGTARAVAPGTVVIADEHFFAGKSVYLDHGNGLISMVFHLAEISVEIGQEVDTGAALGQIGSTGRSTGVHLHLGTRWHRERIDPAVLLASPSELPQVTE